MKTSPASTTTLSGDGAWCWFQDPRAVFIAGRHRRTYAQWMTGGGQLMVGAYDHATGLTQSCLLKDEWDTDDHNVGSFLVLPDRRLMVFYARHNKNGLYCRTARAPERIDAWGEEIAICASDRITYSHPVYLAAESKIYVFWRGETWKPTFSVSADGLNWSAQRVVIQDEGRAADSIRPYVKVVSDGVAAIHIAFTDGHPAVEPANSLYCLGYRDGAFFRANGTRLGALDSAPIAHRQCDKVYDGATHGRAWVWDLALDDDGAPVIAYTRMPQPDDHRYHCARWHGGAWHDSAVTPGGPWFPQTPPGETEREPYYSGGMALDHANPNRLALSRPVNGQFEIELWQREKHGAPWRSTPVTHDSATRNVRPVFPYGHRGQTPHLLWMSGPYTHYTSYQTAIRLARL